MGRWAKIGDSNVFSSVRSAIPREGMIDYPRKNHSRGDLLIRSKNQFNHTTGAKLAFGRTLSVRLRHLTPSPKMGGESNKVSAFLQTRSETIGASLR